MMIEREPMAWAVMQRMVWQTNDFWITQRLMK
jgi:hypothetical protein